MDLDQEWWFQGQCKHSFLNHGALYVIVLDDYVLLEDLDGVELVGALPFGQHHLPEGAFSQNH